jgi:predicted nuclease of predicted toxin-antitoxin system
MAMLRLLADENFNNDIVRGSLRQRPGLDIVRIQDVGLVGASDEDVLAWAAENNRIILTHDLATMADFAYDRLVDGKPMAGVFILHDRFPVGLAIQEILLMVECTEQEEWSGRVVHLPI